MVLAECALSTLDSEVKIMIVPVGQNRLPNHGLISIKHRFLETRAQGHVSEMLNRIAKFLFTQYYTLSLN